MKQSSAMSDERPADDAALIDHERIWLQPKCCAGPYEGRQWCEDNVFDDGECEDGAKATEYVRADRLTALNAEREKDENEAYEIGKRDGYATAVQDIDLLTGGDGEYRACLGPHDPERDCPDADTMKRRIADRFTVLNAELSERDKEVERLEKALHEIAASNIPAGSRYNERLAREHKRLVDIAQAALIHSFSRRTIG